MFSLYVRRIVSAHLEQAHPVVAVVADKVVTQRVVDGDRGPSAGTSGGLDLRLHECVGGGAG